MESESRNVEDREEGEIVDDEFEVVSDCSMSISPLSSSPPHSGKFLASPGYLRAVSLSVSDDVDASRSLVPATVPVVYSSRGPPLRRGHRSKSPHASGNHRRKRRAHSKSKKTNQQLDCESDSDSERLKRRRVLLNKALQRESQEEILHNSLRTRLKAMLYVCDKNNEQDLKDGDQDLNDDQELESLRKIALLSRNKEKNEITKEERDKREDDLDSVIERDLKTDSDSVIQIDEREDSENNSEHRDSAQNSDAVENEDAELINLRIEALRSAMIKKSKERKKRNDLENIKELNMNKDDLIIPYDVEEFDEIDKENYLKESTLNFKVKKCSSESEKVLNESNPLHTVDDPGGTLKNTNESEQNQSNNLNSNNNNNNNHKDNSTVNIIKQNGDNLTIEKELPEKSLLEEDVDILRAMLLASMSRKITNKSSTEVTPKEQKLDIHPKSASQVITKVLPTVRSVVPSGTSFPSLNVTIQKPIVRTIVNNVPNKTNTINKLNSNVKSANPMVVNKLRYNSKMHKWPQMHNIEIKPLIINVNESDSEDDTSENNKSVDINLKETVEQFLKKQRAEVEANAKTEKSNKIENNNKQIKIQGENIKISVNVNTEKVSIESKTSDSFNSNKVKNNKKVIKNVLPPIVTDKLSPLVKDQKKSVLDKSINDLLLNKSSLKLLPKSQQIEYQKLKQQLLNAKKRIKNKRLTKFPITKKDLKMNVSAKRNTKLQNSSSKFNSTQKSPKNKLVDHVPKDGKGNGNIQEKALQAVTDLKNILDDMQMQQNGRLQMKGKYQKLVPLLRKVNQASSDRRQNELEIKRLLSDLQKARAKLAESHQSFIVLVQQLVADKEAIDKGTLQAAPPKDIKPQKLTGMCTSTPNKIENISNSTCDISLLSCDKNNEKEVKSKNSKGINVGENLLEDVKSNEDRSKDRNLEDIPKIKNIGTCVESNEINEKEQLSIEISDHTNKFELVDPNDVEKIFVEQRSVENPLAKYISPLGVKQSESITSDPLKELCPYDLFGVCRDKECPYKHCS